MFWKQSQGLPFTPLDGDVVFQSLPRSPWVEMIEGATDSPFSHCGIVAERDGQWVVYEALGRVRAVPLQDFLKRGRGGAFAAYRWSPAEQPLVPQILSAVREFLGRPYDSRYRMDDELIYCSELIEKSYRRVTGHALGKTGRLEELRWQPYQDLIRRLEGGPVPLERLIITPRDLARAAPLQLMAQRGYDLDP